MKYYKTVNGQKARVSNDDIGLMRPLNIVVAVDEQGGFGKDGKIPWNIPADMKRFKQLTSGASCIMGRKTYDDMYEMSVTRKSKGKKDNRPVVIKEILPKRESFVVSRSITQIQGATAVPSVRKAVESSTRKPIFILGGELIFKQALPWVHTVYMTVVKDTYGCDRFFPIDYLSKHFKILKGDETDKLMFVTYVRVK